MCPRTPRRRMARPDRSGPQPAKESTMITTGQSITNPVTGEQLIFHETAKDTDGEYVLVETIVEPGGFVAAAHLHPKQSERFEVLSGRLGMKAGRTKLELEPGESFTVEPGTGHKFWNASDTEPVRFTCEVRPALQFEALLETMFALAADGRTNRKGMPNPLRLAVIANHHFDTVQLPFPPAALQKLGLVLGAPLGRLLGYGAVYTPVEGEPVIA